MPSYDIDNHTLCTTCRGQVCDLEIICDECRDWPLSKRKVFVNYNRCLKTRREYKKRKARLAGAARSSDQSVYDTDTDVPLDEPSVPVQNVQLESVGSQQCLVSQECVVSEAPSTEVAQSAVLLLSSGDGLEKLASSLFSKFSNYQSERGRPPSVQSHSVVGSVIQPSVADTNFVGVSAPPQRVYLTNPVQPVFRLPTAPVSGETPHHRLVASDRRVQELEQAVAATRQTINALCDGGIRPPQSLFDSASSLSRDLEDARQSSSSQPGVSSSAKRFATATPVQPGPSRPECDPASAGPSRRRSFDSPQGSLGHSSRQGSDTPPRKRSRLSDVSSANEDESSHTRRQRDDQQNDEDNFRPASLALLLDYITSKFPAASKPLVQPSSKRFHVMEVAGLVDESSQPSSNLAWFGHMRNACDSAQTKFEAKILEGRSLSSLLPSVSRTERVSDSPCQGKASKVNSQVYDLMSSKPSVSRSVPLSVKEAAGLETTLRSAMESYNFQLWTITALFRFLGDSGRCSLDDPLLDQFQ